MTWIAAHLHHHESPLAVVDHVVRPVVAGLDPGTEWFFVRYWDGGPHIRLRIQTADDDGHLRAAVEDRFAELVSTRPSCRSPDPRAYANLARSLGAWERSAPSLTLCPDNSLSWEPYRPETHRYGGSVAMCAVEEFFTASSRDALAALCSGRDMTARALWCMAIGLTAIGGRAWAAEFTAHSVSFWRERWSSDSWSETVESAWERTGPAARALVADAVGVADGAGEWRRACLRLQERLAALERANRIHPVLPAAVRPQNAPHLDRGLITWYALHMHNNRLGIDLEREALMMELLARALADTERAA